MDKYLMQLLTLITRLRQSGVSLSLSDSKLVCKFPKGWNEPELKAALISQKEQVKRLLQESKHTSREAKSLGDFLSKEIAAKPALSSQKTVRELSSEELRLWYLDEVEQVGAESNMPLQLFKLIGDLNIEKLKLAITAVADKHEILRTLYRYDDNQPKAVILPQSAHQLSKIDNRDGEVAIKEVIAKENLTQFELASGPLFRCTLLELTNNENILIIAMHHVISDGWSVNIFVSELATAYSNLVAGNELILEPLKAQYTDYVHAQANWLQSPDGQSKQRFWQTTLQNCPEYLNLPRDNTTTDKVECEVNSLTYRVPTKLRAMISDCCREHKFTNFVFLLGSFNFLLSKLSGQNDFLVGCANGSRHGDYLDEIIGCFVNHLVVRQPLSEGERIGDYFNKLKHFIYEAFENQQLPYEHLKDIVAKQRLGNSRLFNVYFNYLNYPSASPSLHNLKIEQLNLEQQASKFDLTLYVEENANELELSFNFDPCKFCLPRVEVLMSQYIAILEQAAVNVDRAIDAISLGNQPVVKEQQKPDNFYPSIVSAMDNSFAEHHDRVAIFSDDREITYQQLSHNVNNLAYSMIQKGVSKGDVVAIVASRKIELVSTVLAILKAGAAFTIISDSLPVAIIEEYIDTAKTNYLVTLSTKIAADTLKFHTGIKALSFDAQDEPFELETHWPHVDIGDLAYIAFTSGTMGKSKAILGGHKSLAGMLPNQVHQFAVAKSDTAVLLSGLGHDPLLRDIFLPLLTGAKLCVPEFEVFDVERLYPWLNKHQVSILNLTPTLAKALFARRFEPISTLKTCLFAGEVLPRNTVEMVKDNAPNARIFNLYGATETQQALAVYEIAVPLDKSQKNIVISDQLMGVSLTVMNKAGNRCGIGEVGELCIVSEFNGLGYLGEQGDKEGYTLDGSTFTYKTGDLGRYLLDGTVEFCGRKDRQIKIRGHRVELQSIEAVINTNLAVESCSIIEQRQESVELVAFIKPINTESFNDTKIRELKNELKQRLPSYSIPNHFVVVQEWPLTHNGKLDENQLWSICESQRVASKVVTPETEIEKKLHAIWCHVLGLSRELCVESEFFEAGGHSLLAMKLLSKIESEFGVNLTISEFFNYPTIRQQAELIASVPLRAEVPKITKVDSNLAVPLSHAQKRLWFLNELGGESSQYNLTFSFKVTGTFDVYLAELALKEIISRHSVLRSNYETINGEPVQRIGRDNHFSISVIEQEAIEKQTGFTEWLSSYVSTPFNLQSDLMLRACFIKGNKSSANEEGVFTLVVHHIATDGWSMVQLWSEFKALYTSLIRDEESKLAETPVQYCDYAVWQNNFSDELFSGELDYWKRQLSDVPMLHGLPIERPRPEVKRNKGAKLEFKMTKQESEQFDRYTRACHITPFILVHAVLALVIARNSNQHNVVIGTPVANRLQPGIEDTIGFFANTLALKVNTCVDKWSQYIEQVKQVNLEAQVNQNLPFDKLVDELKIPRSTSYNPIFQIVLAMNNMEIESLELEHTKLEELHSEHVTALFDLDFNCWKESGCWAFSLVYDTALFSSEQASNLFQQFEIGINSVLNAVSDLVRDINILPKTQLEELTRLQTESRVKLVQRETPINRFERMASSYPQNTALVFAGQRVSYSELVCKVDKFANHLKFKGIKHSECVGVEVYRNIETIVAILALLKLGAVYVPIEPNAPIERRNFQIKDAALRYIIVTQKIERKPCTVGTQVIPYYADDLGGLNTAECDLSVYAEKSTLIDTAYIIYTSGSTGTPKGVPQTNENLMRLFEVTEHDFNFNSADVWLLFHSLAFDFSIWEMWGALLHGGTLVIPEQNELHNMGALSALCRDYKVSVLNQTPSAFTNFACYAVDTQQNYPALNYVIFGGEALKRESVLNWWRFFGESKPQLVNMYGITEITVHGTIKKLNKSDLGNNSIGTGLKDQSIYLLDDLLSPVPKGAIGEICIAGAGLTPGYIGLPEITAQKFVNNPFSAANEKLYLSGDLARYLENGELQYIGRKDNQIKLRGYRIELLEIESKLIELDNIVDAHVTLVKSPNGVESVAAYIVSYGDSEGADWYKDIQIALEKSLPSYMIPTFFVALESLPKTINGKIATDQLPKVNEVADNYLAKTAVTQSENWVAISVAKVLGGEPALVDLNKSFFELGGNSLLAVKVLSELNTLSQLHLKIVDFFKADDLSEIAKLIDAELKLLEIQTELAHGEIKGEGVL